MSINRYRMINPKMIMDNVGGHYVRYEDWGRTQHELNMMEAINLEYQDMEKKRKSREARGMKVKMTASFLFGVLAGFYLTVSVYLLMVDADWIFSGWVNIF